MAYKHISIDEYISIKCQSNPEIIKNDLKIRLNRALDDYKNEVKCQCGKDIWVIASAEVGHICFSCLTGDKLPYGDYEIKEAISKNFVSRHIDDIPHEQIGGIFNDEGYEMDMNAILKPDLCEKCRLDNDPFERTACLLYRSDLKSTEDFSCGNFQAVK